MSAKIITLANYKGGVSKTTSTASIGACLAMKGKKVLLIDLDGQANLTLYYVPNENDIDQTNYEKDIFHEVSASEYSDRSRSHDYSVGDELCHLSLQQQSHWCAVSLHRAL